MGARVGTHTETYRETHRMKWCPLRKSHFHTACRRTAIIVQEKRPRKFHFRFQAPTQIISVEAHTQIICILCVLVYANPSALPSCVGVPQERPAVSHVRAWDAKERYLTLAEFRAMVLEPMYSPLVNMEAWEVRDCVAAGGIVVAVRDHWVERLWYCSLFTLFYTPTALSAYH